MQNNCGVDAKVRKIDGKCENLNISRWSFHVFNDSMNSHYVSLRDA